MAFAAPYIYNGVSWTAADFIADIKRNLQLPASSDYDDDTILEVGNQAILSTLSDPMLLNGGGFWGQQFTHKIAGGNLWIESTSQQAPDNYAGSLNGDGLEYELPPAVSAGTIEFVTYQEADGREVNLRHIPETQFYEEYLDNSNTSGTPWAYCIRENRIKLLPKATQSLSGSINIRYTRRHPKVMQLAGNFKYLSSFTPIGTAGPTVLDQAELTCSSDLPNPTWWPGNGFSAYGIEDASVPADQMPFRWDIISSIGPHGFRIVDMDYLYVKSTDETSAYQLVVHSEQYPMKTILPWTEKNPVYADNASRAVLGTFVLAAAGTSPYVHLIPELREAASLKAAATIARNTGNIEEAAAYENLVQSQIQRVQNQAAPRVKRAPLKVNNPNSIMSAVGRGRRYGRGRW